MWRFIKIGDYPIRDKKYDRMVVTVRKRALGELKLTHFQQSVRKLLVARRLKSRGG
jgi:hypothetical protein